MEHETHLTDHSSERVEPDTPRPEWEDNLTAILEGKDEYIQRLRNANLAFNQRVADLEEEIVEYKESLRTVNDQLFATYLVMSKIPKLHLPNGGLDGIVETIKLLLTDSIAEISCRLSSLQPSDKKFSNHDSGLED